jgi:hypothetical protein
LFERREPRKVTVSGGCVPPVAGLMAAVSMPCERMLIVPVPGGTVKVTLFPTFCCPAATTGGIDPVWTVLTHPEGGFAGPTVPPLTGVGAEPVGVQEGDALADRHTPDTQPSCAFTEAQLPVHEAKQKDPVEVLTQELFAGHVLGSAGLQAKVHAPPGNSGPVAQISPVPVHWAGELHGLFRSALVGFCAGQFAAGTHAPRPAQQVYPVRHCAWVVHAVAQNKPLPLARRSAQTAPLGH